MNVNFPSHTVETAPESARPKLESVLQSLGFIPEMYAKQAEAPILLEAYGLISDLFGHTSFNDAEKLVISMTSSFENDCDFCMTAHSWQGRHKKVDESIITALRESEPLGDRKLEALRQFTRALTLGRGQVGIDQKNEFFSVGYSRRQALEVIVGVAAKVMTNYTNSLAVTPPNPEFGMSNIWIKSTGNPAIS